MKKVIAGLVAVGAVVAFRPVRSRVAQKMRDHCDEMAKRCMQMATQFARGGERSHAR
jgi:hypothetical protein